MSKSSISSSIVAWENVVANAKASAVDVPGIAEYTAPLEQILAQAKELTARLEMRKGVKQDETKLRQTLMKDGRVQVSRIRSALKAHFGPDSERLIEFGARPVRPRKKAPAKPEPPPVPPPETPETPNPPGSSTSGATR
jgi:hypothetical protein